jgi:hypothetical protein
MNSLKERSELAIECLPESPYREQLKKLHEDFIKYIEELESALLTTTTEDRGISNGK